MVRIFQEISFLFLISILSFTVHAADLQAFIQEGENTDTTTKITDITKPNLVSEMPSTTADSPSSTTVKATEASEQFSHIIELVVAGIVASALIISVLVLFLGRWAGRREKKLIKKIRIKAEEEQENIVAAATTVREQEKETTKIVHKIRDDAKEFSEKKEVIENFDKDVHEITLQAKAKKEVIDDITDTVNENVDKIKAYWDEQLTSTLTTIEKVQSGLDKSLSSVDKNLDDMLQQKIQSDELLNEFIAKNNTNLDVINKNSVSSEELNKKLKETLKESTQLLKVLKKHQISAEKSLKKFTEELIAYEEQAYEQFDTSFQVADLARQELNANIDESRKHIETMRRHEEQSHTINLQTQKNLKALDFSKIAKLSHTLDSTFSMFNDMTDKVDETRAMLDELNDLKADISTDKTTSVMPDITANNKPQLAKEVKIQPDKEQVPQSLPQGSPLNIDLKKPVIEAKTEPQKANNTQEPITTEIKTNSHAVPIKPAFEDIITTKKDSTEVMTSLLKEAPVTNKKVPTKQKSLTDKKTLPSKTDSIKSKETSLKEKPLVNKKPKPKTTKKPALTKENPLTTKKSLSKKQKDSILSKKAPKKETLKEKATNVKKAKKVASTKAKPTIAKKKETTKPLKGKPSKTKLATKTKESSLASKIEEQVEIKSVLDSSEASKTAFKMTNAENVPVSFFTNVKKNKPVKKAEKKEPVLGSVKRTLFGNK